MIVDPRLLIALFAYLTFSSAQQAHDLRLTSLTKEHNFLTFFMLISNHLATWSEIKENKQ